MHLDDERRVSLSEFGTVPTRSVSSKHPKQLQVRDQSTKPRYRLDPEPTGVTEERGRVVNKSEFELIEGSDNIFRDLGDPEADLKHAKAVLAARIIATLDELGISVRQASALTGFATSDYSRIRNADLGCFTPDGLMKMLGALGEDLHRSERRGPKPR